MSVQGQHRCPAENETGASWLSVSWRSRIGCSCLEFVSQPVGSSGRLGNGSGGEVPDRPSAVPCGQRGPICLNEDVWKATERLKYTLISGKPGSFSSGL